MNEIFEDFTSLLDERWTQICFGSGQMTVADSVMRLALPALRAEAYADVQIDDYGRMSRGQFPWRPPLRMEVRARSSLPAATEESTISSTGILRGTAGFGFWNYPFSLRRNLLTFPEAIWFFYTAPPSNMALVPDSLGWGWKAQVVHTKRTESVLAVLPTLLTTAWGRITGHISPAAHWLQKLTGTSESLLPVDMTQWHIYRLEWSRHEVNFWVDDQHVLQVPHPPHGPLGFVAWLDNQYAIATPHGILRFGTTACEPQWLELDYVHIVPLKDDANIVRQHHDPRQSSQ